MFGSVQAVLCKFLQRTHSVLTLYVSLKHTFRTSWKSRLMLSRLRYSFPVHILASLVAMLFIMFLLAFDTIFHRQPPDLLSGQTSLGKNQGESRQIPTLVTATRVSSTCFGAHNTFCSHAQRSVWVCASVLCVDAIWYYFEFCVATVWEVIEACAHVWNEFEEQSCMLDILSAAVVLLHLCRFLRM